MVSRKASAPKRAAATQKLSKKAATATEKANKAKKAKAKTSKSKTNAVAVVAASTKKQDATRADASALATTSGSAGAANDKHSDRGKVLYVGHLPHGFYEEQLRGYFSQFGAVTRVRLSRVKKTGKPKSYAFLEFASPAVAAIAADAMDGYLMFSQRLSVKVVAPEAAHPALFKGANRTFTKVPWRQLEAKRANKKLTPEEAARRRARAAKADAKRAEKIKKSGIDYQYERLLEGILEEGDEGEKKKATAKKAVAAKAKTATTKTATAATATAAAAATATAAKKPASKKAASAAPAAAAAAETTNKKKRAPAAAAATAATRSSKRARG